jgi:predicted O-linked N-acetylglucosamine transferase (SPINDLY family)
MSDTPHDMLRRERGDLLDRATALHRDARFAEAEKLYQQLLAVDPENFDAIHRLGILRLHAGAYEHARELLEKAVTLEPASAAAHSNLGITLLKMRQFAEALARFDDAVARQPDDIDFRFNQANALLLLDRYSEALSSLDRLAEEQPRDPEILGKRAVALKKLGRYEEALASYDQALAQAPNDVVLQLNRSNVLRPLRRFEEALEACDRAVALAPNDPDCHFRLGTGLADLQRREEAIAAFDAAIAIAPDHTLSLHNRGNVLFELKKYEDAIAAYEAVLAIEPGHSDALALLVHTAGLTCNWARGKQAKERLRAVVEGGVFGGDCFPVLASFDDPSLQLKAAVGHVARVALDAPLQSSHRPVRGERLRVGYLSADFGAHAVAYLMSGLIEAHDRSFFEVYGFVASKDDGSPARKRLKTAFDTFIDVADLPDDVLCREIRKAGIDILVDLGGHTKNSRFFALAGRPAPIQISYLGYPGSVGAPFIDYIIADNFVVPGSAAKHFSEKVVFLPDCFQVNDSKRFVAPVTPTRAQCGLPEDGFVLCAFHSSYKLNPELFDVWMRLLDAVPRSVIWLVADAAARDNLRREAQARRIDPMRLVFAEPEKYPDHLARQRLADLFIDAWPYNGGTSASDALWVGLPVLTFAGRSYAARMAGSLLRATGLSELITYSPEAYEHLALSLATDRKRLEGVRQKVAANIKSASLFDTRRFSRHIEAAYRQMWERHLSGQAPASFTVDTIQ